MTDHWHKKVSRHYPSDYNIPLLRGRLANRIVSLLHPDGTGEPWSYGALGTTGIMEVSHRRGSCTVGPENISVNSGWKTLTLHNSQEKCQDLQNYSLSRPELLNGWMAGSLAPRGYPTVIYHLPSNAQESRAYECCGLSSSTSREKVVTTYDRDALKRVWRVTKTYPGGGGSVTDTTAFNGLTTTTTRSSAGVSFLLSESTRLLNGTFSVSKSPDADGDGIPEVTSYVRSLSATGGEILAVTAPDLATTITESYPDGRTRKVSGTAVPDTAYSYGVNPALSFEALKTTRLTASGGTSEWSEVNYDPLERSVRTTFPGTTAVDQRSYYPVSAAAGSRGKLQNSTDPDGVVASYTWNEQGLQAASTTTHPGPGESRTESSVKDVIAGITIKGKTIAPAVRVTHTVGGVLQSTSYRSGDGYDSAASSFGTETLAERSLPDGNGAWNITMIGPDGTKTRSVLSKGGLEETRRLLSSTDAMLATESTIRNPLGRILSETDGRTGPTAFGNYTPAGQARSILRPGARLSHFTFDTMGRLLSFDAPDTPLSSNVGGGTCANITRASYWATGRIKAQWGDQSTAVFYLYDEQERMTSMRTYRSLAHNTEPTAATGSFDLTTWNYDPSRGFLSGKLDAASQGALYTYTAAGRLRTRMWARGAWTRYDYHPSSGFLTARRYFATGTPEATVLSASVGNDAQTPDVDYTFDSLGRTDAATTFRGNSPRVEFTRNQFHYTANMTLDSEDIRVSPNGAGLAPEVIRTLDRQEDSLHRSTGWSLSGDGTTHSNIYAYHPTEGRLLSVTGSGSTFTYDYAQGSANLPLTVSGPVHTVTNTWMTDRDALDIKENKVGGTVISKYDYGVNDLGQRSGVSISGTAFGVPVGSPQTTAWGYDALGQVVAADHPTTAAKDFGYAFDQMGNRTRSSRTVLNPASASGASLAVYRSGPAPGSAEGGTGLNQYGGLELYGNSYESNSYDQDGNQLQGPFPNLNYDTGNRV